MQNADDDDGILPTPTGWCALRWPLKKRKDDVVGVPDKLDDENCAVVGGGNGNAVAAATAAMLLLVQNDEPRGVALFDCDCTPDTEEISEGRKAAEGGCCW